MSNPGVFLIGGPPGAGKTTLGCALAARIGGSSVTIDDLMTVAQTATTRESHPDLYLMPDGAYLEYFTNSSLETMQAGAERQHAAVWPFVTGLIEKHFGWTTRPIVIDGWHLRPHRVAKLNNDAIHACWIHIAPEVLEARERKNVDFLEGSSDSERMFQNFLARSLWFNDLMRAEATRFGMTVLTQDGAQSVDELCSAVLKGVRIDRPGSGY